MNTNTKEQPKDIAELADDARALMEATANVTGQKVERARKHLALALERGKAMGEDVIEASTEKATDHIKALRDRVTAALDHGKEMFDDVHESLVRRTKAADHAVRANPYKVLGISLGTGAIVGYVLSSHHARKGK